MLDIQKAKHLYLIDLLTVHQVGDLLGYSGAWIFRKLKEIGVTFRVPGPKGRPWAIDKRGKEYLSSNGYWYVRIPYCGRKHAKKRSVIVLEKKLGRPVRKGYHVHHKNGNTQDDRPSNLKEIKSGDHSRLHHQGKKNPKKGRPGVFRKLTAEKIRRIKLEYSQGKSQQWIADQVGLHQTRISQVLAKY